MSQAESTSSATPSSPTAAAELPNHHRDPFRQLLSQCPQVDIAIQECLSENTVGALAIPRTAFASAVLSTRPTLDTLPKALELVLSMPCQQKRSVAARTGEHMAQVLPLLYVVTDTHDASQALLTPPGLTLISGLCLIFHCMERSRAHTEDFFQQLAKIEYQVQRARAPASAQIRAAAAELLGGVLAFVRASVVCYAAARKRPNVYAEGKAGLNAAVAVWDDALQQQEDELVLDPGA